MRERDTRRGLLTQARQFAETELRGIYSFDGAHVREAIPLPLVDPVTRRNNRHNAVREVVEVQMGEYLLRIKSCEEAPPLGAIELEFAGQMIETGRIDPQTWKRLGATIRERGNGSG